MKLAQCKIKWLARLMLVLMLCAQGIVDATACLGPSASAEQAYAMADQGDEAMPCHEGESPNANACLAHCTQSDQIGVDQHQAPLAAPVSAIAWVNSLPQAQRVAHIVPPQRVVLDTGPPIPIRFCSLLN